ncbi:MoaD/ThiS family protein [Candidatus Woesearchaeota archaeon]|nr:MoaD/ThiS family protein [Candidatus Woesearchaeota archaeon]
MNITVYNEREKTTLQIEFNGKTVTDLLKELKINPEVFLVVRNNEVIIGDETVHDNDVFELLSVVSGG